jgi:hypothetical protein
MDTNKARRKWLSILRISTAILAATLGCAVARHFWTGERVTVLAAPHDQGGPIQCRIALFNRAERLSRAGRSVLENTFILSRIDPPVDNPLLMNGDYARVEVENTSGREITAFKRPYSSPDGLFGYVTTEVVDESGSAVEFSTSGQSSLKMIDLPDPPRAGDPTVTWKPGQVLVFPFRLFGSVGPDSAIRPGNFITRARFLFFESPGGGAQEGRSRPIAIRVTWRDILELRCPPSGTPIWDRASWW